MENEAILKLKIAFSQLPMKGLFFWEALLYLDDNEYNQLVEENFNRQLTVLLQQGEDPKHYLELLELLKEVRKQIETDSDLKTEIEAIRNSLIEEETQEAILESLRDKLAKDYHHKKTATPTRD